MSEEGGGGRVRTAMRKGMDVARVDGGRHKKRKKGRHEEDSRVSRSRSHEEKPSNAQGTSTITMIIARLFTTPHTTPPPPPLYHSRLPLLTRSSPS